MNFIITIVSTFFYNYIFYLILGLFPLRNKKKPIYVTVISIFNIGEAILLFITMLNNKSDNNNFYFWYYYLTEIAGVLIAYIASLLTVIRGIHIKSRRQRQFEREMDNTKAIVAIIFDILMTLLSIALIVLAIATIIYKDKIKNYLVFLIPSIILAILFLLLALYSISIDIKRKDKKIKGSILFFIKAYDKYHTYLFESKNGRIEDYLGRIAEIYNFSDFGFIKNKDSNYRILGINPQSFDEELFKEIKLEKFDNRFDNIFNEFDKYNMKKIILDEDNNIIEIKSIK